MFNLDRKERKLRALGTNVCHVFFFLCMSSSFPLLPAWARAGLEMKTTKSVWISAFLSGNMRFGTRGLVCLVGIIPLDVCGQRVSRDSKDKGKPMLLREMSGLLVWERVILALNNTPGHGPSSRWPLLKTWAVDRGMAGIPDSRRSKFDGDDLRVKVSIPATGPQPL